MSRLSHRRLAGIRAGPTFFFGRGTVAVSGLSHDSCISESPPPGPARRICTAGAVPPSGFAASRRATHTIFV